MSHILETTKSETVVEDIKSAIKALAKGARPARTPVLKSPADHGLTYEDIFFQSLDGVPLEGWFIPADSDKLIICNHPGTFNRYGFPGHLEPWSLANDFEVNFLHIYEALVHAGYNVLAYDMRNHGASGSANNGVMGYGMYEWRDSVGAMQYVKGHEKLKNMVVGWYSPCAGGNATLRAMTECPEVFKDVKALICPQPCSASISMKQIASFQGLEDHMEELDFEQQKLGGIPYDKCTPHPYALNVSVPTFIIQVHDDPITLPIDVQTTYDLIPIEDKKLFWIEGTTRRFDGYNYFGQHPEMMVEWFDKYIK
ncbi:alpha/beta hydrolase [Vibrio owensii]|uniref:alpha/beta hydrolase family protein n=1 Tax=Vibrio owensii TaxID=696485 RepID=UPI002FF361E2